MSASEIFVEECRARGVEVTGAAINVGSATDPGAITGGEFRDVTGAKKPAPIMPRVVAAFEATRAWALGVGPMPPALVGLDVLIGAKS